MERPIEVIARIENVRIDYRQPLAQMIAAGKYGFVRKMVYKKFPVKGSGEKKENFTLLHSYFSSHAEFFQFMKTEKYKSSRIEHLLAFSEVTKGILWPVPIFALGSMHTYPSGGKVFTVLDHSFGRRHVEVEIFGQNHFVLVRDK